MYPIFHAACVDAIRGNAAEVFSDGIRCKNWRLLCNGFGKLRRNEVSDSPNSITMLCFVSIVIWTFSFAVLTKASRAVAAFSRRSSAIFLTGCFESVASTYGCFESTPNSCAEKATDLVVVVVVLVIVGLGFLARCLF